ncbi:MAG: MobQ family relaxase [Steroidobacteraceae bacterium]
MAFFRFAAKPISRSAGRSAPAAAAYRAGERIRDERTRILHNYRYRRDVTHTQILLPNALVHTAPDWVQDRQRLWNEAEAAERQRNSRVAREYQLSLPHELNQSQRLSLARGFAQEIADRHGVVVDLCLHDPKPVGDPRNFHAHLLVTTREITPDGLGAKAGLDLRNSDSLVRGLLGEQEYWHLRERWAVHSNDAYRSAGLEQRVEHRTLAQRGLEGTGNHKSFIDYQIERRRMRREIMETLAARYRQRIEPAAEQAGPPTAIGDAKSGEAVSATAEPCAAPEPAAAPSSSALIDDARRRGREAYAQRQQSESRQAEKEHEDAVAAPTADEDLSL